jgi:hypothetical protein
VLVLPNTTPFPAPAPGDDVVLHLDAQAGAVHWFHAFDREQGVPLPGTTVLVSWEEEDGRTRTITTPGRPDGYAFVLGIRPGTVRVVITKPGYCPGILPAVEIPAPVPAALSVIMHPCEQVSGRVVRDGKPVPDFELTSWPSSDVDYRMTQVYRDRADGSFTVEASSDETLGVVAAADGSPGSMPVQVQVPVGGLTDLEVELVGAIRGSGRVLRAEDGQPLPDASDVTVQPYVTGSGSALTPWGPPLAVSADGSFSGASFRRGANRLIVSAPGFATRDVFAESEGGKVDFGVVAMKPASNLRAVVQDAADGRYILYVQASTPRLTTRFERDEDGALTAVLEDLPEGKTRVELDYPNGQIASRDVTIQPGWNVARFRAGSGVVVATVRGRPSTECSIGAQTYDEQGAWQYVHTPTSTTQTTYRLEGLPPGPARIYFRDYAQAHASAAVTIAADRETHVELVVGDAELIVRVVDAEEDPLAGARVLLHGTEETPERHGGTTDEDGELRMPGLRRATYLLHVSHPSLGLASPRSVEFGGDEAMELEVELDGGASLELQLLDGDLPLAGLECRLIDALDNHLSAPVLSNAEGRALIPRLTAGSYRLRVTSDSTWPLELDLDVQPGAGLRTVEARRLGDLLVRALSPEGLPVSGLDVEITDLESGVSVQEWLGAGRVVGANALATDLHGEIELKGLPRGSYAWRAGEVEGTVVVKAGQETLALLPGQ